MVPSRPVTVVLACVFAWLTAGFSIVVLGLLGLLLLLVRDDVTSPDSYLDLGPLVDLALVAVLVGLAYGVLVALLALLTFRGSRIGRVLLAALAALTAAGAVAGLTQSPDSVQLWVHLAWFGAIAVLPFAGAGEFFRR